MIIPILLMFSMFAYDGIWTTFPVFDIIYIAICGVCIISSIIYYFVRNFKNNDRKILGSKRFIGLCIVAVSMVFAGLFYSVNNFYLTLLTLGIVLGFVLVYVLLVKCTEGDLKKLVSVSLVTLGVIMITQALVYYIGVENIIENISIKGITFGWAGSSAIAFMFVAIIPSTFYLAYISKKRYAFDILAVVFMLLALITNCRSMLLAVAVVMPACVIYSFIKARDKKEKLFIGLFYGIIFVILCITMFTFGRDIFLGFIGNIGFNGNGRKEVWTYYINKFIENPIFGVGYFTNNSGIAYIGSGIINRAHDFPLQTLACGGIVGALCFIPYFIQKYKLLFTKFSMYKMFMVITMVPWSIYALIDNAYLSFPKILMFIILFFACEVESDETREEWKGKITLNKKIVNKIKTDTDENVELNKKEETAK
ncbi:MAG: O-antigen ligase family protein [Clostridia bacterium]